VRKLRVDVFGRQFAGILPSGAVFSAPFFIPLHKISFCDRRVQPCVVSAHIQDFIIDIVTAEWLHHWLEEHRFFKELSSWISIE
jgi:hypothetical protein